MSKDPRRRVPGLPGSSLTRALAAAGVAIALASSAAMAAWSPTGFPFSTANGDPSGLCAVTDGRGGFIAAWIDTNGGAPRVLGQRVDSTGATQWGVAGVVVNSTFTGVSELAIAADGQNGALLAWVADRAVGRKNVYVQRLNANGGALWTPNGLLVDPTSVDTLQGAPAIDSDGNGGAIVAWKENRGNTDWDVQVQRILSDSSRAWMAGGVGVDSTDNDGQGNIRLLGDGAGGAWIAWDDSSASLHTRLQRYDASGTRQWADGGVTPTGPSTEMIRTLMARVQGGDSLFIAWGQTAPSRLHGTLMGRDGSFLGSGTGEIFNTSQLPSSLLGRAGGFLLVLTDANEIRTLLITAAGVASGTPNTIATGQALTASSNVTTVSDGTGGWYVVWASGGTAYARRVRSDGVADWAAVPLTTGVTATQTRPVAVGGFDLLAAWADDRNAATTGLDLFAQRVSPTGVTGRYHRIYASVAGGNGQFLSGGGRTWVRFGDSLRVRHAGTGGHHVASTVVGATNLGAVPNYTFRGVAGDSTLQVTFSGAPVTGQLAVPANAYRAFSVPATLSPATVSNLFGAWMPYDPVRWRLGHWEPDSNRYLEPSSGLTTIQPATGYWFIGAKDTTLSFSGTFLPETQYSLTLKRSLGGQGWNQFGSPFTFPVAVSQLRLSTGPNVPITDPGNALTDHQVLEWVPGTGSYEAVGVLYPGRAYWLWRQSASAVSLQFPYEWNPVALAGGLAPGPLAAGDWSVSVLARAGERGARLVFGAAPVEAGRWNPLSGHAPPASPGASVSLVARVSDWGEDNGDYASVFRPDAATLAWDFDAVATPGMTETSLSFEFAGLPAGRRVRLSEPAAGWEREVTGGESVALVLSGNTRRLRLEVLADGPVAPPPPRATALRAVGPNPFRESASLSFSIARGGPLRWDVFDLAGRRVVSGARALDAGEHVVTWDGRDAAGRSVEPGLYLLRWQADGRAGTVRLVRTD